MIYAYSLQHLGLYVNFLYRREVHYTKKTN